MSPATMTVAEIAAGIRSGALSPAGVLEACLARIEQAEPALRAWVHVDRDGAMDAARALEAEARAGRIRGPLHGVPVGIKDIYHVAGMVTTAGAAAFAHERPADDAETVARLRRAGAVILGKTATTEFAYADPTDTRNPWHLDHTPGGSSSGSAAAVAARMIPLALGTQTIGSTLRPAAYCGIVGLKPTHGRISAAGIVPLAWSLDHVGIFARSVADAALAFLVLAADGPTGARPAAETSAGRRETPGLQERPPRLGVPRGLFREVAAAEVTAHLEAITSILERAGAAVEEIGLPPEAGAIHDAGQLVLRVEAASYHADRFARHADEYRPRIRGLIDAGLAVPAVEYVRAQQARQRFRDAMGRVFERCDALLMPVAPAPAPRGFATTGDPVLCAPWSFAGLPAIALPSGVAQDGLPLAIQLVAGAYAEDRLLAVARWCEGIVSFSSVPAGVPLP